MKTLTILTFALAAAVSATTAPCSNAVVVELLTPFDLGDCAAALDGDQGKTWTNTNCDALYKNVAAAAAAIEPPCSMGGVDSTDFSSMDPEKGLKTMLLSYRPPSGSFTTAVPATPALRTTTAPSTTKTSESAAYTPAPTKPVSSAITTGAGLAFVALALAASMA